MPGGSLATTGHTSGSESGVTPFRAGAVADCALQLVAVTALNAPPRNARLLIMPSLPSPNASSVGFSAPSHQQKVALGNCRPNAVERGGQLFPQPARERTQFLR